MLPAGIRFQVCLPTPFAVVSSVVIAQALAPVEAAYERAMIGEVAALCRHIPHGDLCIQWDVCNEMVIWDGQRTDAVPFAQEPREKLLERIARLAAAVPHDVQLGLHLCYGDFGARHFVEPRDATAMVEFANALARAIDRKLAYIHMPVPIERSDDAFHRPFAGLALPDARLPQVDWQCRDMGAAEAHGPKATPRHSASPPNAACRAPARRRRCTSCCSFTPRFARNCRVAKIASSALQRVGNDAGDFAHAVRLVLASLPTLQERQQID